MFGIIKENCSFVIKHRAGFLKRNLMLLFVDCIFIIIPLKTYRINNYIIIII